jgi:hypothetical protein
MSLVLICGANLMIAYNYIETHERHLLLDNIPSFGSTLYDYNLARHKYVQSTEGQLKYR